jgi:hypothetical protein
MFLPVYLIERRGWKKKLHLYIYVCVCVCDMLKIAVRIYLIQDTERKCQILMYGLPEDIYTVR